MKHQAKSLIVNDSLVGKLRRRMKLNDKEVSSLQRKFERYKALLEPGRSDAKAKDKSASLDAQNVEKDLKGVQEIEKAKEELAEELSAIVNKTEFGRGALANIRKIAGVSLAARAIEDLVGKEKISDFLKTEVLAKALSKSNYIIAKIFQSDIYIGTTAVLGLGAVGFGALSIVSIIDYGINAITLGTAAGFVASSAILLGLIGFQTRHIFHSTILEQYLKSKQKEELRE